MKTFLALFVALGLPVLAQRPKDTTMWAPKPTKPTAYVAPQRPHTKLADLLRNHAGSASWQELIVDDDHFRAAYIASAPGAKTERRLHPDTREWWIVMGGQIRFSIDGQQPFVASKGTIVQVPMRTAYSMETVGDAPSLRFEVNIAHAQTLYPSDVTPPSVAGVDWIQVLLPQKPGVYDRGNKPFVTFESLAAKGGTQRVVEDDRGVANFIYGYEKDLPPIKTGNRGHYHPECAEFWLILAGQIRYAIENQSVFIADVGDVVYVPKFTFHAPRFYGPGPSCRLAMNGYPEIAHLFDGGARE